MHRRSGLRPVPEIPENQPGNLKAVYDQRMQKVTAYILAGGRSSRMGRDKAVLEIDGQTLLDRAIELGRAAGDVVVVGDPTKYQASVPVVADIYPDHGPLGGIHAALKQTMTECNLVLAVDMPFVAPEFLRRLLSESLRNTATVTIPRTSRGFEPLCAVYRREFAIVAERALEEGRNKIDSLLAQLETRIIEGTELIRQGFSEEMFRNLNTPEDWHNSVGKS